MTSDPNRLNPNMDTTNRRLITSALPYVNNVPHLGNLIQVLSADAFARFCRSRGYETLYICGTDEYGTATETKAMEEGCTPRELCDRYYKMHDEIYRWFNISFDRFGRTSSDTHSRVTQDIFSSLDKAGYIVEKEDTQLFCDNCSRFLADRYVRGGCPFCSYTEARGDQCEECGKLLDPSDLVDPKCGTCKQTPKPRKTRHLYIDLPAILPLLEGWLRTASKEGNWSNNSIRMTEGWINSGLHQRGITRDLKWGIPVPKDGFRDKVFYVWFDAPIGYISITADLTDKWEEWWRNPDEVKLYQFIGKDNIPFHTVIFPSSLLGSGEKWTMLHHVSSSEYLNYENSKFSKSKGIGVFGSDAMECGIPADMWRFYIFYNRPEKTDTQFTWSDFMEKVNSELIGNLSNLVNRTVTFASKHFGTGLPATPGVPELNEQIRPHLEEITELLERAELREAFRRILRLSSLGNKAFQDGEPWRLVKEDPGLAAPLIVELLYLVRVLAILIFPYLPETSSRIAGFLGNPGMEWSSLGDRTGITRVERPSLLFSRLEAPVIEALRKRFSGSQEADAISLREKFRSSLRLIVARIEKVEPHPDAERLYVETLDTGEGQRQIVSGLVGHYTREELLGRHIVLVANLKSSKFRGIASEGMLLAASEGEGSSEVVDVLFADHAPPGTPILLEGDTPESLTASKKLKIDEFFEIPMKSSNGVVVLDNLPLTAGGRRLHTTKVLDGSIG